MRGSCGASTGVIRALDCGPGSQFWLPAGLLSESGALPAHWGELTSIIDEEALVEVLQAGRIAGAALDVFEKEPLPETSPLLALDNVLLTSHSIGWTFELFRDMGRLDCEGALAVARGEVPANVVNREVLVRPGFLRKLEDYRNRVAV